MPYLLLYWSVISLDIAKENFGKKQTLAALSGITWHHLSLVYKKHSPTAELFYLCTDPCLAQNMLRAQAHRTPAMPIISIKYWLLGYRCYPFLLILSIVLLALIATRRREGQHTYQNAAAAQAPS